MKTLTDVCVDRIVRVTLQVRRVGNRVGGIIPEVVSVPTGLMMTRVCVVWIEKCCVSEYAIASSPALAEV